MQKIGTVFVLVLSLVAMPAFAAETPSAADLQQIQRCLEQAEKSDRSGMACAGAIADPCIAKTENGKHGDPKLCAKRELAVWTNLLGAAVAKVAKGGFAEVTAAIRKAQQTWMASREQVCRAFDHVDPGMAPGGSDYCRILETAGRTLGLRQLGAAFAEH